MALKNSLKTVFIGLIVFISALFLLFANEQNYVNSIKKANYTEKNVIELQNQTPSQANEGNLVYISGLAGSTQKLNDEILSIPNAIALIRTTEMYQWQEVKTTNNGYQYKKEWNSTLINSDNFEKLEYKNPKKFQYSPKEIYAKNVYFGRFYLSSYIVKKIKTINKMQQLPYNSNFKIYNGFYFTGKDYDKPQIGDQKLFYSYIPSGIRLSIIAKQTGNLLEPMHSKYGDIVIISNGNKSLNEMLNEYRHNNANNCWIIRGILLLILFLGLNLIIQPLVNSIGKIPIIGATTQFAAQFITIILTFAIGAITISLCWLAVRPEIAVPAIILSIITIISLKKKKKIVIEA